jgi:hypothetical protein
MMPLVVTFFVFLYTSRCRKNKVAFQHHKSAVALRLQRGATAYSSKCAFAQPQIHAAACQRNHSQLIAMGNKTWYADTTDVQAHQPSAELPQSDAHPTRVQFDLLPEQ